MKKLKGIAVLAIGTAVMLGSTMTAFAGTWKQSIYCMDGWEYLKDDGTPAKDEWVKDGNDWYYFGQSGFMEQVAVVDNRYPVDHSGKWNGQTVEVNHTDNSAVFSAYQKVIAEKKDEYDHYFLFDITHDGTPEMILMPRRYQNLDGGLVYSCDDGTCRLIGAGLHPKSMVGIDLNGSAYLIQAYKFFIGIQRLDYQNGEIITTEIALPEYSAMDIESGADSYERIQGAVGVYTLDSIEVEQ